VKEKSIQTYINRYGSQPEITILSPGRINLIGEHIDYYGGWVLPAAIDRYIALSIGAHEMSQQIIYSSSFDESIQLTKREEKIAQNQWGRYLQMSTEVLSEIGLVSAPFTMTIDSNLPVGAGLSSSAALVTGFFEVLALFNGWSLTPEKNALLAQSVEHRLGTPCGLMDQYASLFGRHDSFLYLDCQSLKTEQIKIEWGDYQMALYNTKVHHTLTDGGYARRRQQGEAALDELKVFYSKPGSFREFTLDELEQMPAFDPLASRRARHAITEHQRVRDVIKAIDAKDLEQMGSYLYASHASLRDDYEVSCREADFIVSQAQLEGVAGARIVGGGFGGCVLVLIHHSMASAFQKILQAGYSQKFHNELEMIPVALGQRQVYFHTTE
jgi:galactokinase